MTPPDSEVDVAAPLAAACKKRGSLLRDRELEAVRLVNGAGDGMPGLFVDRFGDLLIVHVEAGATGQLAALVRVLAARLEPRAIYAKELRREVRTAPKDAQVPMLVHQRDESAPDAAELEAPELTVREHAFRFLVRPCEGYSPGLFLDQRDNRLDLAREIVARLKKRPECTVLNLFSYTCSFSVAAALAAKESGIAHARCHVTSVDLSQRWLDWGVRNFAANGLDPAAHEFARGDALTFLGIAAKKKRHFDVLVLDPPTFATSKQSGIFQVERDYPKLFELAVRVAAPGATLLCSHNQRDFTRPALVKKLKAGAVKAGRRILRLDPFQSPADFPGADLVNPAARGYWAVLA
jgi:23S rRNA (cytosine1962-C5)-methyltransferase